MSRRADERRRILGDPPARETLIDRQIREAIDEGKFDDLPFQGQRIPLEDDAAAGEWALAYRMLRNAGVAPPWIEADKEVRELLARRDAILARASGSSPLGRRRDRDELAEVVARANAAIARVNAEAPLDRLHRAPLDVDAELERLRRAHGERDQSPGTTANR